MDSWPQNHQNQRNHKRNHDAMSHQATLSPSAFIFDRSFRPASPIDNPPTFVERRRTSHPHNQPLRSSLFVSPPPNNMPERRAAPPRPTLEHRASQTIIDLTVDADDVEPVVAPRRHHIPQELSRRPPQLGRSDGSVLEDVIDLTEDGAEDDIQITGERSIPGGQPVSPVAPRRLHRERSHNHFERNIEPDLFGAPHRGSANFVARHHHHLAFMGQIVDPGHRGDLNFRYHDILSQVQRAMPPMPGYLNYQLHAFNAPAPAAPAKPAHEPPPAAKEGFTRSPTEEDIIICPCCENELEVKNGEDEKPPKRGGRPPTRKDREEHPFWVLKDCGHVYCNKCYQHRRPDKRSGSQSLFPESTKINSKTKSKVPVCAVEGCETEVTDKIKWVGVFI